MIIFVLMVIISFLLLIGTHRYHSDKKLNVTFFASTNIPLLKEDN